MPHLVCFHPVSLILRLAALQAPLAYARPTAFLLPRTSQEMSVGIFQEEIHNTTRFPLGCRADELHRVMRSAAGCGENVDDERLSSIRRSLVSMWQVLPKNNRGRAGQLAVRYLVYHHFMRQSSLSFRGFEPLRPPSNQSARRLEAVFGEQGLPSCVTAMLESPHAAQYSFDLDDVVHIVVMLEQSIHDSDTAVLEHVYQERSTSTQSVLGYHDVQEVLESYLVHRMLDHEHDYVAQFENKEVLVDAFPKWSSFAAFVAGQIRALDFSRARFPFINRGSSALSTEYSFNDVQKIVRGITATFASYMQSECSTLKQTMSDLDTYGTGRVALTNFYRASLSLGGSFSESEAYLREIGALDETSTHFGAQVIIPNYMMSASNCVVSTPFYLLCCRNECEGIVADIERAIPSASASPEVILEVLGNLRIQATLDDDDLPNIGMDLVQQLEHVATLHNGTVPVHGRLFAQLLHYAFPRECPFPHKIGTAAMVTPRDFGDGLQASFEEIQQRAFENLDDDLAQYDDVKKPREQMSWMSQWTHDEEFFVDAASDLELHAPWDAPEHALGGILLGVIFVLVVFTMLIRIIAVATSSEFGTPHKKLII